MLRVGGVDALDTLEPAQVRTLAAAVIEPLIQGAAGMRLWPPGTLETLRAWCDRHGVLLIADEVMTGFGRTGTMFACEQEGVLPDFLCLAKGLTGGYLPLAATLTTERVYEAFLGDYRERRRSFTATATRQARSAARRRWRTWKSSARRTCWRGCGEDRAVRGTAGNAAGAACRTSRKSGGAGSSRGSN